MHEKLRDYLAAGTRVVVVGDPQRQRVAVHQPDAPAPILTVNDTLDLHPSVQGWRLMLADLFAPPRSANS